ncbi:MAG: lipopolysaccharide heptosyltransferase II [Candidatus Omnitrophica bacterium]|nr:lipopolysaccharide heptosyltransferase II [Candidatus Omnitrophota bacterium]
MVKRNKSFKKILIINPFGVGDLLFSTPLIKNLKHYYPKSQITVLTAKRSAPVLKNNLNVDLVIGFNRGDFKELKKESRIKAYKKAFAVLGKIVFSKFDLFIDLSLEHRYSLFVALLGVKPRIGYNYKKRGRFLTEKVDIGGFVGKHVVEYHLSLLRFLGFKPNFSDLELFVSDDEKKWAKDFLKKQGLEESQNLIILAPGGGKSWGDRSYYLQWPKNKFIELAKELMTDDKIKIMLVGDSSDKFVCDNICNKLDNKAINICGQTNLRQFFAVLAESNLVVCNDTGILHMASALDRKIVCLCGPVDEDVYGPYPSSEQKQVVSKDFPCRPCYNRFGVPECKHNHQCLEQIEVEEVLEKIKNLF